MEYSFQACIRLRSNGISPASWHFVTVPKELSEQIEQAVSKQPRKGRGSVRVEAFIGFCTWKTSIFPDKKSGCYILPLKADIRKSLQIKENDDIGVRLKILVG